MLDNLNYQSCHLNNSSPINKLRMSYEYLLTVSGLDDENLGRVRDIYLELRNGKPVVVVFTRNGGGNRECIYSDVDDDDMRETANSALCDCQGCVITYANERFNTYLYDEDWDFDFTYAYMYFSILPEYLEEVTQLVAQQVQDRNDY